MNKIILFQLLPIIKDNYKILGIVDNVIAFSNKSIIKKVFNYLNGTFTGIRWQCVEFARRYMIINSNITFNEVTNAYEIFKLNYFINLNSNVKIPIKKILNGSIIAPKVGSLLIWDKYVDLNRTGHVAVITKVQIPYYIVISEQNWHTNKFSRKLYIKYSNGFIIQDKNIIGWINY